MLHTENTKMFRHPKYYKELRKRNKLDQVISDEASTEATSVHPDPGPKPQAPGGELRSSEPQASSNKLQAPSSEKKEAQASSPKQQASSSRPQASSSKI
jgi:hypothetical protein